MGYHTLQITDHKVNTELFLAFDGPLKFLHMLGFKSSKMGDQLEWKKRSPARIHNAVEALNQQMTRDARGDSKFNGVFTAAIAAIINDIQHKPNLDLIAVLQTLRSVAENLLNAPLPKEKYHALGTYKRKYNDLMGWPKQGPETFLGALGFTDYRNDAKGIKLVCFKKPSIQAIKAAIWVLNQEMKQNLTETAKNVGVLHAIPSQLRNGRSRR